MWPLRHFALWFSLSTLASFLHSQPSWPWPCKIVLSTWDVQIRAQTRETHLEQGSPTGLGHFHHPQSLSGKFRPSSRQAAGCAQGDLQGMKLLPTPGGKSSPDVPGLPPTLTFAWSQFSPAKPSWELHCTRGLWQHTEYLGQAVASGLWLLSLSQMPKQQQKKITLSDSREGKIKTNFHWLADFSNKYFQKKKKTQLASKYTN